MVYKTQIITHIHLISGAVCEIKILKKKYLWSGLQVLELMPGGVFAPTIDTCHISIADYILICKQTVVILKAISFSFFSSHNGPSGTEKRLCGCVFLFHDTHKPPSTHPHFAMLPSLTAVRD